MDNFTIFTWALTAVTIAGTYLNSKQNKYGFLVWGLCNMLWLGVDFTRGIYAQAALYVVFVGFNIYGWKQWGKKEETVSESLKDSKGIKMCLYGKQDPNQRWDTPQERKR